MKIKIKMLLNGVCKYIDIDLPRIEPKQQVDITFEQTKLIKVALDEGGIDIATAPQCSCQYPPKHHLKPLVVEQRQEVVVKEVNASEHRVHESILHR